MKLRSKDAVHPQMQKDLELELENLETFHPSFYSREMDFIVIILIPDRVDERESDG